VKQEPSCETNRQVGRLLSAELSSLPVVLALDDPLVSLQLVLQGRLVHGQVATLAGVALQAPLRLLHGLAQRLDLVVVCLDLVFETVLRALDALLQRHRL